jgi:hypothetical protein
VDRGNLNKGITLSTAKVEYKDLIKNLYSLYLHDLSEFDESIEHEKGFFI